jgi:hypothetical protein
MGEESDHIFGLALSITLIFMLVQLALYKYASQNPKLLEKVYDYSGSSIITSKLANKVLISTRLFSFIWWFGLGWIGKWSRDYIYKDILPKYKMFTHWNIILMAVYFFLTLLATWQKNHSVSKYNAFYLGLAYAKL